MPNDRMHKEQLRICLEKVRISLEEEKPAIEKALAAVRYFGRTLRRDNIYFPITNKTPVADRRFHFSRHTLEELERSNILYVGQLLKHHKDHLLTFRTRADITRGLAKAGLVFGTPLKKEVRVEPVKSKNKARYAWSPLPPTESGWYWCYK